MKVLFIVGSGHCGSTLLDMMLNGHSRVFGAGELASAHTGHADDAERGIWTNVFNGVRGEDLEVHRSKMSLVLGGSRYVHATSGRLVDIDTYCRMHEEIYGNIIKVSGKAIVSDSTKDIERVALLTRSSVIEPILIHLVRDGRAVTWSYLRKFNKRFIFSMTRWFSENTKIEIMRRRLKGVPYLRVRYEDLVRDPRQELTTILRVVGESFEYPMLDFRATRYHGIGGNRMKLQEGSELKEDIVWRYKMPFRYRLIFSLCFGWLNHLYRAGRTH